MGLLTSSTEYSTNEHMSELAAAKKVYSIIIPTFRRCQDLCKCLDLLAPYFAPTDHQYNGLCIEVVVSDDARENELRVLLNQRYPWCRYVEGPARGPAANRNHGARESHGEWIVFTDDDCLPQPGWIGAFATFADQCDVMEGKTSPEGQRSRLDEECPSNENGGFLWSCNFAIRREAFFFLNGFNEDFPAPAMEDVEFRKRLEKSDLRLKFVSTAQVNHPWRRRKGFSFLRAKSKSIAIYVRLHPETIVDFSLRAQIVRLLVSLRLNIKYIKANFIFRGIFRQILLDIYSSLSAWHAVRRVRLNMVDEDCVIPETLSRD